MAENRRKLFTWLLIGGGALLFMAGLASIILNGQSQVVGTPTPATVGTVQRLSLADAKDAFDDGKAVFLDVRDRTYFAESHIPGALSIPLNELPDRIGELDPGAWIIPY